VIRIRLEKDTRELIGRLALAGLGVWTGIPALILTWAAFALEFGILLVPASCLYVLAGSFFSFALPAGREDRFKPVRTLAIPSAIRNFVGNIIFGRN
jgi:hypothetical protein